MAGSPIYVNRSTRLIRATGQYVTRGLLHIRYSEATANVKARAIRYTELTALAATLTRFIRYVELTQPVEAFASSGYYIYAKNLATGVETNMGFIAQGAAPLQLAGIALADGKYELRARLAGYYWREARHVLAWQFEILAGAVAVPLPAVSNLAARYASADTVFSWNWNTQTGTAAPADFGIWTGAASPVSTVGAPAYTLAASAAGSYSISITQGAALYVAVCSRSGALKGPISELYVPAPPAAVASPDNQIARLP